MRISDWSSDVCSSDLVAFQSGQHFILIRTQERFYENRCVAQIRGHADFSDADCMGAQHVVMHIAAHEDFGKDMAHLLAHAQHADGGAFSCFGLGHISLSPAGQKGGRSEEHTSELQSLMRISYAVFFLKKK